MPPDWRRGPILGVAASGAVVAVIAGYTALSGGLRVLAAPGALWEADLSAWPTSAGGVGWQAPIALALLAGAAAIVLPRPWAYDVAAVCVGLATIGAPVALGLPWWSPLLVGGAVAAIYGVGAVIADDPRAGLARAAVAAGVALHAAGASLVRPWTTAAALIMIVLVGALVATLARMLPALDDAELEELPGSAPPPRSRCRSTSARSAARRPAAPCSRCRVRSPRRRRHWARARPPCSPGRSPARPPASG
ncbi:hypothetical protein Pflav_062250 [Phytohabitans flavus]|uniref:Uncharacterized protein n=1 Tax=Phytohabitans flavus TaxID=1076124 RepID=A0A6F8Y158_9ACTN|nr:hypothetical protein Pflav_062250 [Phytohabitans flavus]